MAAHRIDIPEGRGGTPAGQKDARCSECGEFEFCSLIYLSLLGKRYLCDECVTDFLARNGYGEADCHLGEIVPIDDPRVWTKHP